MEKQLAEYRARKSREALQQKDSFVKSLFTRKATNIITNTLSTRHRYSGSNEQSESYVVLYPRLRTCLKVLLWVCFWGFFVQVGFGIVFFVASLFYFLYSSMESGTRRAWEPSAYSVFNENCEAIEGTLSGKQFEKELKFGAGSVGK